MKGDGMLDSRRTKYLSHALRVVGLFYIFGLFPLMRFLPDAWSFEPRQPEYEQMILGIYAMLGIFLLLAARQPDRHLSLIWFTIWSNIAHAGIMSVQVLLDVTERANLFGSIPALIVVAIVLWTLMPRPID